MRSFVTVPATDRRSTKKIKVNKPVGDVICQRMIIDEWLKCRCSPTDEEPCGVNSECWNRMLFYECHPSVCPAGDRCSNRSFQLRLYLDLVPVKTDCRGWGLKTLVNIPKGHFVIECVGELVTETEPRKTSVATCWLSTVRESLMLVSSLDATLEQLDSRPRSELYCNCNW